jgi:hypothetical protein
MSMLARWGVDPSLLNTGQTVEIAYADRTILATVLDTSPQGRNGPERGWITVEQITDYEDHATRPRFNAAVEYIRLSHNDEGPRD